MDQDPLADAEKLYQRILYKVAAREDGDPDALPSLGEAIDVDALERFLASVDGKTVVYFTYLGYDVVVTNRGTVQVSTQQTAPDAE